ncbi:MAG TPA: FAD binding domain-containing protein [Candidatus Saccharimonadales bacterium]|nr:FAD binding domain-containing protein [Candidatus Saccharimonadales bacterium]
MSLPEFKLLRPRTIQEAVGHLARHRGDILILAGGTDLLPSMRQKLFTPGHLMDMRGLGELRGVHVTPGIGVEIGALTTLSAIEDSEFIRRSYRVLHEAVVTVASPILRNMGTLGGNICLDTRCVWYNQSLQWRRSCGFCIKKDGDLCHVAPGGARCWAAFSGDTPPALLCLDAQVEIAGPIGVRRVPLSDFYTNVGEAHLRLDPNEMLTRVFLPETSAGWKGSYLKLRVRGSIDYPLTGVAVALKQKGSGPSETGRVAITAVNPSPMLVKAAEHALTGKQVDEHVASVVAELAAKTAKPLTTSALTPEYRREMVRVFAKRAVLAAAKS